ncbi:MAG: protein meaA [Actinobacteria bacterium]|nr:protein meaA [Actinomycetota bacterium]MCL5446084.1 protein meaA [Actinomycetota bacterium]
MTSSSSWRLPERDKPWVMRTYSGHSSAAASNELYRSNLAKGQTGLSVAFDLPTQTGYDPDAPEARGEVGKVGVPIVHIGHMQQLMDSIPLDKMNTSMTINATAPWLLSLYIVQAENSGVDRRLLTGTTQNDILKEYLSRGAFIFPPAPSLRLTVDLITYSVKHVPRWNPMNICGYHLQEAGATPSQEVAYALANAIDVLDAVNRSGQVNDDDFPRVVGRMSFFVNSGIRFVEETCKLKAFAANWDRICSERYHVTDPKLRRFRYGVQVNSLGLTEAQPENNIARIILEMLGVTLSRSTRARAVQLPAWNEALGLPRKWDQQWSLRMQQVMALETDLLEYPDIFEGSKVIESAAADIAEESWTEMEEIIALGGAFSAVDEMKMRLVASQRRRVSRIESGELPVVGVNCHRETEPSPLDSRDGTANVLKVDPAMEKELREEVERWRSRRNAREVTRAIDRLRYACQSGENIMEASVDLARVGGTTGEWAGTLRDVFGDYRAPTGVGSAKVNGSREELRTAAGKVRALSASSGSPPRILVAKPGLDGHSNGSEQIALAARDAGFEVIYQGIRTTPEQIASAARDEDVDLVGISILSGGHMELIPEILDLLAALGVNAPVVAGGIIPPDDAAILMRQGVHAIYTPKDFKLGDIISDMADLVKEYRSTRT